VALVIGDGVYKDAPLKNLVNDARDMAAALKGPGFEVIQRENADLHPGAIFSPQGAGMRRARP
jgi:uncharacterized caspase-like protein